MKTADPCTCANDILVVDDTPANLQLLSGVLEDQGYNVRFANNGTMGLMAAQTTPPPDLILLDIKMPDMNGYEVCQRLKSDNATQHIPIIFVSAMDEVVDKVQAFQVGGVDYISKPFHPEEVIARVQCQLTLLTQQRELEARYKRDVEQYEALDKMKTRFVNSATHDLKNPLNVIMGYATLLQELDGKEFEDEGRHYIESIQNASRKMQYLITDMLDLAQLNTGANLNRVPVSMTEFLGKSLMEFEFRALEQGVTLLFLSPEHDVTLHVDKNRMARVIDNLVSNAIKYTLRGGRVELSGQPGRNCVVIQVSDTGLGIPAEAIPHLFETFYRINRPEHREIEGTGLGLSIVKAIVEQHGGQVEVESEPGKGSRFTVILPQL